MFPSSPPWSRASGRSRWAAIVLSLLLLLVLLRVAQETLQAPYDGLVEKQWLVARVIPGSPAEEAGFQPGDRLLDYSPTNVSPAPGRTRVYRVERRHDTLELPLTYSELPVHEAARRLSQTVVGLVFLAIGLMVFLQRSDKTGTLFFLTCFFFAGVFASLPPIQGERFFLLFKVFYDVCVLLLPAVFLHFFLVFPQKKQFLQKRPFLETVLYTPVLVMLVFSLGFDVSIIRRGGISQTALAFQDIGSVVLAVYYLLAFFSFGHSFRTQQSLAMKRRLRYVLAGTIAGAGPLVVLSLVLSIWPSVEIPGFRYSFLTLLLIPLSFGHAIVRYRLLDLDILVRRSVAYALLTAALVAIYVGVVQGLGGYLFRLQGRLTLFLSVLSIFIIALVFNTLRDRIQRIVDRLFYIGRYSFPDTLRSLSQILAQPLGLYELLDQFVVHLAEVLKVRNVCVLLHEPSTRVYRVAAETGLPSLAVGNAVFRNDQDTVQWLEYEQMPLPLERLTENPRFRALSADEQTLLERTGSALLAPVVSERRVVAVISVGRRKSGGCLSRQDLALVEAIASQTARTIEAAALRQEKETRERMQQELQIAREIQTRLLPKSAPCVEGLRVSGMNIPSQEVGGDYYDYIVLGDHRLGLAIADVAGKGVSAALLMATLQAAFRAEAETQSSPAAVLQRANLRLLESFGPERFASFFYGIVDVKRMRLTYASAGHDPPFLIRAAGTVEPLDSTGIVLGVSDDAQYIDREISVDHGDTLFLYTDGVTEELNEDEETFGQHRLQALLTISQGMSPEEMAQSVYQAVQQFTMGSIQDDVTLVTLGFE